MAEAPEKPETGGKESAPDSKPEIRIQTPKGKPEIKIRKLDEPAGGSSGAPDGNPKKPVVRVSTPSPAPEEASDKKQIRIRPAAKPAAPKPPAPSTDMPETIRVRGPQGQERSISLAGEGSASDALGKTPESPSSPAPKLSPTGQKPGGKETDTSLSKGTGDVTPPDKKTSSRLIKSSAVAAGATQGRAPSYAGGVKVSKRKRKDAGPVVSGFAVLTAIVGLVLVYLLAAQVLPELSPGLHLPVPKLFQ